MEPAQIPCSRVINGRSPAATEAAEVIRAENLRGVVALGGGSVLDAGKAAAMLATNDGQVGHYEGKNRYAKRPLPMIAIPTTCGTGSEVTWVSVLTVESTRTKISVKGESMFPDQALVDPDVLTRVILGVPRGFVPICPVEMVALGRTRHRSRRPRHASTRFVF